MNAMEETDEERCARKALQKEKRGRAVEKVAGMKRKATESLPPSSAISNTENEDSNHSMDSSPPRRKKRRKMSHVESPRQVGADSDLLATLSSPGEFALAGVDSPPRRRSARLCRKSQDPLGVNSGLALPLEATHVDPLTADDLAVSPLAAPSVAELMAGVESMVDSLAAPSPLDLKIGVEPTVDPLAARSVEDSMVGVDTRVDTRVDKADFVQSSTRGSRRRRGGGRPRNSLESPVTTMDVPPLSFVVSFTDIGLDSVDNNGWDSSNNDKEVEKLLSKPPMDNGIVVSQALQEKEETKRGWNSLWGFTCVLVLIGLAVALCHWKFNNTPSTLLPKSSLAQGGHICFENSPVSTPLLPQDEKGLIVLDEACHKGSPTNNSSSIWVACPLHGICQGGRLVQCEFGYDVANTTDPLLPYACHLSPLVRATLDHLHEQLLELSSNSCDLNNTVRATKTSRRKARASHPSFPLEEVVGDYILDTSHLSFFLHQGQEAKQFVVQETNDQVWLSLHPTAKYQLSAVCRAKLLGVDLVSTLLYIAIWAWWEWWRFFWSNPVCSVLLGIAFRVLYSVYRKRAQSDKITRQVLDFRERVYGFLQNRKEPTDKIMVCEQVIWDSHPSSRVKREYLKQHICPHVIADIESDARVRKIYARKDGKRVVQWLWVASASSSFEN